MTGPTTTHSVDERIRALGEVGFEIRMMAHASARLGRARQADDDPVAQNAYIDSAHLHARLLIDFFMGTGRSSDILRTDFAPEWAPVPLAAAGRLKDSIRLLHKYLAHLAWDRVSADAPAWNYPNSASDILDVADAWSEHLARADHLMGSIFQSHVTFARQTLEDGEF